MHLPPNFASFTHQKRDRCDRPEIIENYKNNPNQQGYKSWIQEETLKDGLKAVTN